MHPFHRRVLILIAYAVLLVAGCDDGGQTLLGESDPIAYENNVFDGRDSVTTDFDDVIATQDNFEIATEFVLIEGDAGLVAIDDPETIDDEVLLFESREGNEIRSPDGDQVSWGEFSAADGGVVVQCNSRGTHVVSHFGGLVANGLYSLWIRIFDSDTAEELGELPIAEPNGEAAKGVFRASAVGEVHVSGFAAPDSDCLLNDAEAGDIFWQVVAIYHIDDTPGIGEDEAGTFVEQAQFNFGDPPEPPVVD